MADEQKQRACCSLLCFYGLIFVLLCPALALLLGLLGRSR